MKPVSIKAPHGARIFEIQWEDGKIDQIPHSVLRGYCPCAGCQGHSGSIAFQKDVNLELRDIRSVGNYALSLAWGDGHSTGIYTFEYLRHLGQLLSEYGEAGLIALNVIHANEST